MSELLEQQEKQQAELFTQGRVIALQMQGANGIVQNMYLPSDVDPAAFHQQIADIKNKLTKWETDVSAYYHNMPFEVQKEIRALQHP